MSFFKRRSNRNAADEASGGSSQAQSIESLRKSARHRLIGATVLVVVSVIGFPLLFDTQPRPIKSDIQIEIAERDKVPPSQAPSALKSPADKSASADKTNATHNEPTSDKLRDGVQDADKGTHAESSKTVESKSGAAQGGNNVSAVGAVGAVAAAGVAAQKLTNNISALTTPAAPSPSTSPSTSTNNAQGQNITNTASSSPVQATGALQAEKSKGSEPKEVIISTKAPDAKVASALSTQSSAPLVAAPASAGTATATPSKSSNSAVSSSTSNSAVSSNNSAPSASVSAASKSSKPNQDKESKKDGKDAKDSKESKDAKPVRQLVQVGVFTDAAKVREHKARLEKAGFSVLTHSETAKDGTKRIRLRIGPYKNHDEAQRNLERVKEMKIQGAQLNLIPLSK
jgi:DedD protein